MNLVNFDFNGNTLRTITISGEPWFVAKDVCSVLDISNSSDALSRLDIDEKGVANTDTLGGIQEMAIINESGLYSLTLTSRKPEAKAFKKWITSEVLPSIRKTGRYSVKEVPTALEHDPAIRSANIANAVYGLLSNMGIDKNSAIIGASQVGFKYTGVDVVKDTQLKLASVNQVHRALTVTQLGSKIGMSAVALNRLMSSMSLQVGEGGAWHPTSLAKGYYQLVDTGKRRSSGKMVQQVLWYESVLDLVRKELA